MFGCASHVGVVFDIPTIGVAKKSFDVDGLNKTNIKEAYEGKLINAGDTVNLVGKSGKIWGAAYRSTLETTHPIFVSVGHRISLESAIKIVKSCVHKYRIPEPIRQADLRSREKVRTTYDKK